MQCGIRGKGSVPSRVKSSSREEATNPSRSLPGTVTMTTPDEILLSAGFESGLLTEEDENVLGQFLVLP